jgi:hypothetical protein
VSARIFEKRTPEIKYNCRAISPAALAEMAVEAKLSLESLEQFQSEDLAPELRPKESARDGE